MHGRHLAVTERCECCSGREYFGVVNPEITRINRVDVAHRCRPPDHLSRKSLSPRSTKAPSGYEAMEERRPGALLCAPSSESSSAAPWTLMSTFTADMYAWYRSRRQVLQGRCPAARATAQVVP